MSGSHTSIRIEVIEVSDQTHSCRTFDIGGMWEETWWKVDENVEVGENDSTFKPCPHCDGPFTRIDDRVWRHKRTYWTCPRVIVAINEGGYNSTGVCLDCVIDAVEEIKK